MGFAIAAGFAANDLHRLPVPMRSWVLWQHEPRDQRLMQWQVQRWRRVLPGGERTTTPVPSRNLPARRRRWLVGRELHPVRAWGLQP